MTIRRTPNPESQPLGGAERTPTSYRMVFEHRRTPAGGLPSPSPSPSPPPPSEHAPASVRHFDPEADTIARERIDLVPSAAPTAAPPPDTAPAPASASTAPSPPSLALGAYAAGDVLAQRYRLVEQIGRGGMGAVWRARSLSLELDVALKLIRRDAEVQHAAERLLKEARAAARVAHPSAVRVFDFGVTQAGDPFLVMELLHGTSLSQRLTELGRLPALEAVQIVLPVAGALAAAHREGVVHRDVKPANIMLLQQGAAVVPKLIDFGVAGVSAAVWAKRLTTHGMMIGSPVYMAPEQIRGGADPDDRTDVWGLCTSLYELVSGARPFPGTSSVTVIFDILNTRLRRPEQFADHQDLWMIVERGLAKAPADRWPSMAALGRALADWALLRGATFDATGASLAVHWLGEGAVRSLNTRPR